MTLLREFHAGDLDEKIKVLQRLRGLEQQGMRIRLLLSEKNPEWRTKFLREFVETGDALLDAMRELGAFGEAEELLKLLSPRSWAVYLSFAGRADARVAEMSAAWERDQGSVDPMQLFWLWIVTDRPERAREVAEQAGLPELQREIYLRQRDWTAFMELGDKVIGTNAVEHLGFQAWLLAAAGDTVGAQKAIDDLSVLELPDNPRMAMNRTEALVILGRHEQAANAFGQHGDLEAREFGFHLERMDFETLATRFGMDLTSKGIGEEMRGRVEVLLQGKGNDATARRELFNLSRMLGDFLVRIGHQREAREVFLAARRLVSDQGTSLSILAGSCRAAGFDEEADSMELQALQLGGNANTLRHRFPRAPAEAQFWWEYFKSEHPDETKEELLKRVSSILEPEDGEGRPPLEPLVAEALEWVEKQTQARRAASYKALAEHYRRIGNSKRAADYLRKQSALCKNPVAPLLEAGDLFASQNRWKDAMPFYAEAVTLDPDNELGLYLYGTALVASGMKEEGESRKAEALAMPLANSGRRNSLASGIQGRG